MNSMVSRLLTIITGRLSPWIFECTHGLKQTNKQSINQDDQSFISILDYPWPAGSNQV